MLPSPTILCPVDFSDCSRMALGLAGAIAHRFAGRLTVLHVNDPLLVAAAATRHLNLAEEADTELREMIAATVSPTDTWRTAPTVVVTTGKPESQILTVANDEQADLVVMGTRGLTGYRKAFFGSTTERVLRHTELPVLAVPLGLESGAPATAPLAFRGPVIAAVDFSEASTQSVRFAVGLAKALDVPVLLAHIAAQPAVPQRWQERGVAAPETDSARVRRRLEDLVAGRPAAVPIEIVVASGAPAEEIARLASARKAGLIVMGLHGAGGLLAPAIGSTAYRVLSLTPVPVLAIPGHQLRSAFFRALEDANGSNAPG